MHLLDVDFELPLLLLRSHKLMAGSLAPGGHVFHNSLVIGQDFQNLTNLNPFHFGVGIYYRHRTIQADAIKSMVCLHLASPIK